MQPQINLWLWRYRDCREREGKYHLRADAEACVTLSDKLRSPEFVKSSCALRPVPEGMTHILSVRDPRFISISRLRIFREYDQPASIRFEETDDILDLYLNTAGIIDFAQALDSMSEGQWDFRTCDIWFWGTLSEDEYKKKYA
jgi:hypothetical protein